MLREKGNERTENVTYAKGARIAQCAYTTKYMKKKVCEQVIMSRIT